MGVGTVCETLSPLPRLNLPKACQPLDIVDERKRKTKKSTFWRSSQFTQLGTQRGTIGRFSRILSMISSTPIVSLLWAQWGHNGGTIGHNWENGGLAGNDGLLFSALTRGYRNAHILPRWQAEYDRSLMSDGLSAPAPLPLPWAQRMNQLKQTDGLRMTAAP